MWKIRLIAVPAWKRIDDRSALRVRPDGKVPEVGDAWYEPPEILDEDGLPHTTLAHRMQLSRQYHQQHAARRLPIMVVLPDTHPKGLWHCVDSWYHAAGVTNPTYEGWQVTGTLEAGTLTVAPSIHYPGTYHGWLRQGVISADVEGRTFPHHPSTLETLRG